MDLFNGLLLIGAILGTTALFMEFHLHGWLQLIIAIICTFTVVFLGGAFFGREVAPDWAIIAGKILVIGGMFALATHVAHAVQHSGGGHGAGGHGGGWGNIKAILVWVVAISLTAAIVAYDPATGFRVPTIPSPPTVTIPSPPAPPTASAPVTPPSPAAPTAPAATALPAGTTVGPIGLPPVPCDGLSFTERRKRGC